METTKSGGRPDGGPPTSAKRAAEMGIATYSGKWAATRRTRAPPPRRPTGRQAKTLTAPTTPHESFPQRPWPNRTIEHRPRRRPRSHPAPRRPAPRPHGTVWRPAPGDLPPEGGRGQRPNGPGCGTTGKEAGGRENRFEVSHKPLSHKSSSCVASSPHSNPALFGPVGSPPARCIKPLLPPPCRHLPQSPLSVRRTARPSCSPSTWGWRTW